MSSHLSKVARLELFGNINKEINDLLHLINYKFRYGFFPVNNDIINNLEDEVWKNNKTLKYDEMQKEVTKFLELIKNHRMVALDEINKAVGNDEERLVAFRKVRDQIQKNISRFLTTKA